MKRISGFSLAVLLSISVTDLLADDPPSLLEQVKQAVDAAIQAANDVNASADADVAAATADPGRWHATLEAAVSEARTSGKPIFAIVGAPWCAFCQQLTDELNGEPEAELADKWVLAKINADDQINDARELRANALPALRLLSSDGIVTASREGYVPLDQLASWLDESYEYTKAQMPGLLTKDIAELDASEIDTLISLMAIRDVTARRVVLNRLAEMPQFAAARAIDSLAAGGLARQLSALQLLRTWDAPVAGLDPWEPASIDEAAVQRLQAWGAQKYPAEKTPADEE